MIAPRAVLRLAEAYLAGRGLDDKGWEDSFAANAALQMRFSPSVVTRPSLWPSPITRYRWATARALGPGGGEHAGAGPGDELRRAPAPAAGTDAVRAFLAAHPAVTAVAAFDDEPPSAP